MGKHNRNTRFKIILQSRHLIKKNHYWATTSETMITATITRMVVAKID